MKTYRIAYRFQGDLQVEAENADEAQLKFDRQSDIDLARHVLDSLEVMDVTEEAPLLPEPKEPEGLSRLKESDMVRI